MCPFLSSSRSADTHLIGQSRMGTSRQSCEIRVSACPSTQIREAVATGRFAAGLDRLLVFTRVNECTSQAHRAVRRATDPLTVGPGRAIEVDRVAPGVG